MTPAHRPGATAADALGRRDPGLQAERTALSWQRTALGGCLVALVALASAARGGLPVVIAVAAATCLLSAAAALVEVPRRVRPVRAGQHPDSPGSQPQTGPATRAARSVHVRLLAGLAVTVACAVSGVTIAVSSAVP